MHVGCLVIRPLGLFWRLVCGFFGVNLIKIEEWKKKRRKIKMTLEEVDELSPSELIRCMDRIEISENKICKQNEDE